jgi:scyllo-inositol 2-dehydrogenase (NADP+)
VTIKAGIIGYGGMGSWHGGTIKSIPEFEIAAIHDIKASRLEAGKRDLGAVPYEKLEDFLAHPGLEIVTIATPNDVHKPLACACMEAGKHVIVEKPVALNLAELDEMIATSKRTGSLFTIHQNRRWDRDYLTVKKFVEDGTIGKVHDVQSRCVGWGPYIGGWRAEAEHGGGLLYDWGIHLLDQMLQLTHEMPTSVFAKVVCLMNAVDDYFKIQLRWRSGFTAEVEFSNLTAAPAPRWTVLGDKGTLIMKDWGSGSVFNYTEDRRLVETQVKLEKGDWRDYYAKGIYQTLREGKELRVKPESVRPVMMLIDACRKSSETGRAVEFEPFQI